VVCVKEADRGSEQSYLGERMFLVTPGLVWILVAARKRQFSVAIVEDDAGVRAAIQNLLESNGFRCWGFSSAAQFLRSRQGTKAACLILDLRLNGMSGLELHRALQAKGLVIPVIFVTAEDNAGKQLSQAPALAVLSKPFDSKELVRLVRLAAEPRGAR
jgi:FixJ family two-component response regulator